MNKKPITILSYVIVIASIAYLIHTAWNLDIDLRGLLSSRVFYYCLAAVSLVVLSLHLLALTYKMNVDIFSNRSFDYGSIKEVFIKANIGKYIPGNIWHFAARNILGQKYQISHQALLKSTLFQQLQVVSLSLALSLLLGYRELRRVLDYVLSQHHLALMLLLASLAVIAVSAAAYLLAAGSRWIRRTRSFAIPKLPLHKVLVSWAAVLGYLLVYTFSFLIIVYGLQPETFNWVLALPVTAGFIAAWITGMLVPGASAGIGVREAVLILLLKGLLATEQLVVAVVTHRLCAILGDLLAWLVATRNFLRTGR